MKSSLEIIETRLSSIESKQIGSKDVLTLEEVAAYTGISKSYLYKLTSTGQIAHYKPKGKLIFFNRVEVDQFLLQNRVQPVQEVETKAAHYVALKKGGRKC